MDIHWRNTQKPARFFMFDARAFFAILLCLVHARLWTFMLALFVILAFAALERRGLTFDAALRALRSWITGAKRPANHRRARRRWTDFGGL
jgi:intracellular multiplication protein IcmT